MRYVALLLIAAVATATVIAFPLRREAVQLALAASASGEVSGRDGPCERANRFVALFRRAAAATDVPQALLLAVAEVESRFDVDARSSAGARGLMQVLPSTARELQLDPERPAQNVLAGARYLRRMLDRFQSLDLALAAYNAGPASVERAHGSPDLPTLEYAQRVTARWIEFSRCARLASY